MADVANLKIVATADINNLTTGLSKSRTEIAKTALEANKLDKSLGGNLTKGSNSAAFALTNLGRVAQDAPFGFIGIQNNLNPLLESFQRLRAESGSTSGALKALGSSLIGGAGIGLAISVVTGLLTVLAQNGFFKSAKAADAAAESYKKLQDVIDETSETLKERSISAAAGLGDEIAKVNSLAAVIQNQTLTYQQRNNALLELQKINKNYFGDIALEGEGLERLTSAVNQYTDALIASAVVKSFSQDIGKLSVEFAVQLNSLNRLNKELDKNNAILKNTKESTTSLTGEDRLSAEFVKAKKAADESSSAVKKQSDVIVDLSGRLRVLKDSFQIAIQESLKFKPLEDADERVKKIKKVTEELGELKKVLLDVSEIRFYEKGRFDEFLKNVKPDSKVFNTITLPVKVDIQLPDLGKSTADFKSYAEALRSSLEGVIEETLGGIGEAIGNAIVNGGDIGSFFDGMFKIVGAGLKQLGQYFIQTGVLVKAFKDQITLKPALAIVAGVALVALGSAIQAATAKKQAFATGGLVGGTGNRDTIDALLTPGEFVLTKSAVARIGVANLESMNRGIVPAANSLQDISGGNSSMQVEVTGNISGDTIYLANSRASQRRGRQA